MGGPGMRSRPCPFLGFRGWQSFLAWSGNWPQGLLDAYIAMISKGEGESVPSVVLPLVKRLWASLRLSHLKERVQGGVPRSVFSLGDGLSSVEAWFSAALDIEEVLAGAGGDQLHVLVANVINFFDTVDRVGGWFW